MRTFDVVVIGGGPAGEVAAGRLAEGGLSAVADVGSIPTVSTFGSHPHRRCGSVRFATSADAIPRSPGQGA